MIAMELLGLMLMRVYLAAMVIFFLNALSRVLFAEGKKNRKKAIKGFFRALGFIPFWFLAIFSPEGREVLFNRIKKI